MSAVPAPRVLDAAAVEAGLPFPALVDALEAAFRAPPMVPLRQHYGVPNPGQKDLILLSMPAWAPGRHIGIKTVIVGPDNAARGLPTVLGAYLLFDGATGIAKALIDGPMLTLRRTAAASALAARHLARADARRMVMVGAGALAPHLVEAHLSVRPIAHVRVWNRNRPAAEKVAARIAAWGIDAAPADDLEAAVRVADVVSCATLSTEPLVKGDWLKPGAHLDLVGGFTPEMRETDDEAVSRARVFVDTREGVLAESGEIVGAIARGAFAADRIAGDLFELASGTRAGRASDDEITLFKSVGTAIEDLAAAEMLAGA
jgi:ornithine cyclodeaminase